ncbi:hypothetical protein TcasGA2_TC012788 [Tribolium castaneum]|uniref:Uncharacterized protein n=1 Tax=Tribolium castaneum TaxID=7070 RepID=D6X0E9_TRICA|nr:hypothetical protein TcasGA2_TC012788 [Tribolium castaneum]
MANGTVSYSNSTRYSNGRRRIVQVIAVVASNKGAANLAAPKRRWEHITTQRKIFQTFLKHR